MDGDECWDDLDLPANGFEDGLFNDANSYQNLFEENTDQFEEEGFTESNLYVDRFAPAQSAESAESRYPGTLDFEDDDGEKGGPPNDDATQQENLVQTEAGLPGAMTGSVQRLTRRTQDIIPQAFEAWQETDNDEIRSIVMTGGTAIETESTRDFATPTPPNSHPTFTATDLEAMEMDFDFPDDLQPLKLADRSSALVSGLVEMGDASTELDLGSDGWGDILSVHGGLPSLRFGQSSPTPSSAPSIVASESEEDGFDDIEFPDTVEALRLGTFRHALHHDDSEPEGDDADHPFEGLVMPEDGTLDPRMLATLVRQKTSVDPDSSALFSTCFAGSNPFQDSTDDFEPAADFHETPSRHHYVSIEYSQIISNVPVPATYRLPEQRQRKKPTLIQNLNNTNLVKVVGDMVYNPALQKWEGNQSALLEFERAAAPTPRPALIANVGGYKTLHAVGGMVFDPVQMRWLGNEDEADVFQDFPDDMSVTTESVYGGTGVEMTEFQLPKSRREAVCIAESAHKLFMGKWYPKAILDSRTMIRDTSKTHLYEIRSQTNAGERRRGSMWR
ncbi:hypothetical protein HKX48_002923 [Thoreauomyces humboldtii]|nr:hypothetical protein HKX48_002923 [Thoreauomyces humboldtii]